jgi:hypothetical protein
MDSEFKLGHYPAMLRANVVLHFMFHKIKPC